MRGVRVSLRAAVLLVLGAWLVPPRAGAQSVVVGPVPSSLSAIPGATVAIPVVADLTSSGGASLGSLTARLTWKAGTLAYVGASAGALGAPTVNADSAPAGILKFAVASPSGATGLPVLMSATFTVTGAPADTTQLGVSVSEITASGTFADLKPITTTTGARFCTSTGLWGDLDGDGQFTGQDALIIVTNAVGLPIAPYSVVNGDVDGSGVVDTRDALIVLSAAVGLPVSQFKLGRLNSGICSVRTAASVQIEPRTPSVAPGDSLPVTATVRDSGGALVQGVGLLWQSRDATIVRAGTLGSLVAIAPGSTYATVVVQPGVKDSVPVTVTSVRHVWYVNPAVAAGNLGVELGSQLYPFSTIDTAVARAGSGDTVRIAVADYGPATLTKPLVVLGDSSPTGFPRLGGVLTAPALRVDSVPTGVVEVRGLRLVNAYKGLVAKLVRTLVLGAISVEGSRDLGLRAYGVDSLSLSRVSVVGAVGEGLELDSVRSAVLDRVRADVIARPAGDSLPAVALRIAQTGTVTGDSITLATAGATVDSAGSVSLRRIRVSGSRGPALRATANAVTIVAGDFSGATSSGPPATLQPPSYTVALNAGSGAVRFDSSVVHDNGLFGLDLLGGSTVSLRGDTVTRNFPSQPGDASSFIAGFGWLRLAQTAFVNNGLGLVSIEGLVTDSVTADSVLFDGTSASVFDVSAFRMHGGLLRNAVAPVVGVENVATVELDSVEATGNTPAAGFTGALEVDFGDSVFVNGLNAHDNASGALAVYSSTALRMLGGTLLNNAPRILDSLRATLGLYGVSDARIVGVTLRDTARSGLRISPSGNSRTVVDSSAFEGSTTLVEGVTCCTASDTLVVSRASLTGPQGTSQYGVAADYFAKVAVTGTLLDSLTGNGIQAFAVDSVIAFNDTIRAWGNAGINVNYGVLSADSNAFAGCAPNNAAVHAFQPGTTRIVGNTLTGCSGLVWVEGAPQLSGPAVRVIGNTVTRDTTTSPFPAFILMNGLGYVEVSRNAVAGGTGGGIVVNGSGYALDSARVDTNVVRQVGGTAITLDWVTAQVRLRYNLLADNGGTGLWSGAAYVATHNTVVRNGSSGLDDNGTETASFRLGNIVGNLPYGIRTFAASFQADSNWWGRSQGPKCAAGCDTTTTATGDSISGNVVFAPVVDTGAVAGAPAIPAPPGAPLSRPLAVRSGAVPRAPKATAVALRPAAGPRPAAARAAVPARVRRPRLRAAGPHVPIWKLEPRP